MQQADWLFEASWEVCNKVGGIYTVVTSKLSHALAEYGEKYIAIGPYFSPEEHSFIEEEVPEWLQRPADALQKEGIIVHYGKWQVAGLPSAILLDWSGFVSRNDSYKSRFWEHYSLDTLGTDFYDFDQPFLWSLAVGRLCEECAKTNPDPVTLQAHEWMSGSAILLLAKSNIANIRTVFTTHATVLGRALSGRGREIYKELSSIQPEDEARSCGVLPKHSLERLAAVNASIFTVVSQITAEEATAFLGRKPEVVVENGLDLAQFPAFDRLSWKAHVIRQKIEFFLGSYFAPSYELKPKDYSLQFTMGRYEIHNKGYDLHLKALGRLNDRLKAQGSDKGVITLFLVPADARGLRQEVALLNSLNSLQRRNNLDSFTHYQEVPHSPYLFGQGDNETFIKLAREYGLRNREEDKVKVLFFPAYLDGLDGIFNEHLYDIISGLDLGVFPSLYEPWGYTPMESLAMGVPAVTSNLAGFGRALPKPSTATFILDRLEASEEQATEELVRLLRLPLEETARQWVERRMKAYHLVQIFDWGRLYPHYRLAYDLAWR